jgi:hypothetical protein
MAKARAYIESQPLGFFSVEGSLIGEIKAYFETKPRKGLIPK